MARRAAVGLALALLVGLVYGRTLPYPFVFDDHVVVAQSPSLDDPGTVLRRVTGALTAPSLRAAEGGAEVAPGYRPVRALSYALDRVLYRMGPGPSGLKPWGFRLTNLLLHLCTAYLVFSLGASLCGWPAGLIGALLFCVHPVATEAVTYVSGRKDLLASAFFLGALRLFLWERARSGYTPRVRGRFAAWTAILTLFALALGAKEMAITLPLACLAVDLAVGGRGGVRRRAFGHGVLLLAAGVFAALTLLVVRPGAVGAEQVEPIAPWVSPRILTMARVVWHYLGLVFGVVPQSADLSFRAIDPSRGLLSPATGPLALAGLGALGWALLRGWRAGYRVEAALAGLFFGSLLPVLQIVPHPEPVAERYLYLPLAFLSILAGRMVVHLALRLRRRSVALALLLVVGSVLGVQAFRRNAVWASERMLFGDAARAYPGCARANLGVAMALRRDGEVRAALDPLDRALAVLPPEPWTTRRGALRAMALFERATVRGELGLVELALRDLDQLLAMPGPGGASLAEEPAYAYVHLNRAVLLQRRAGAEGDLVAAKAAFARVLSLVERRVETLADDAAPAVLEALGWLVFEAGRQGAVLSGQAPAARRRVLERARSLLTGLNARLERFVSAPTRERSRLVYRLGVLQAELGDREGAAEAFSRALGLDPDFQAARLSLADQRAASNDPDAGLRLLWGLAPGAREHARVVELAGSLAAGIARPVATASSASPRRAAARAPGARAAALLVLAERAERSAPPRAALAAAEAAWEAAPDSARAARLLARIAMVAGAPERAFRPLGRQLRKDVGDAGELRGGQAAARLADALVEFARDEVLREPAVDRETAPLRALGGLGPWTVEERVVRRVVAARVFEGLGRPAEAARARREAASAARLAAAVLLGRAAAAARADGRRSLLLRLDVRRAALWSALGRLGAAHAALDEARALARREMAEARGRAVGQLLRWDPEAAAAELRHGRRALEAAGISVTAPPP